MTQPTPTTTEEPAGRAACDAWLAEFREIHDSILNVISRIHRLSAWTPSDAPAAEQLRAACSAFHHAMAGSDDIQFRARRLRDLAHELGGAGVEMFAARLSDLRGRISMLAREIPDLPADFGILPARWFGDLARIDHSVSADGIRHVLAVGSVEHFAPDHWVRRILDADDFYRLGDSPALVLGEFDVHGVPRPFYSVPSVRNLTYSYRLGQREREQRQQQDLDRWRSDVEMRDRAARGPVHDLGAQLSHTQAELAALRAEIKGLKNES